MSNTAIIRVYTRETGGAVSDTSLTTKIDAQVVVEVEASHSDYGAGAHFETGLTIKDLVNGSVIPFAPAPYSGAIHMAPWSNQAQSFTYTISAASLAPHAGHVCQIHAYLLVGMEDREASFAESTFLVTP